MRIGRDLGVSIVVFIKFYVTDKKLFVSDFKVPAVIVQIYARVILFRCYVAFIQKLYPDNKSQLHKTVGLFNSNTTTTQTFEQHCRENNFIYTGSKGKSVARKGKSIPSKYSQ